MAWWRSLIKLVSDPKPVSRLDELEDGRAVADGFVRPVAEKEGLVSPVRSQPCVAFFYRAFYLAGSRGGGMVRRNLQQAEVYGEFYLEMAGGRVHAVPGRGDPFTGDDHRRLSGAGYEGFHAEETLVSYGSRVRLWGKVRRHEDGTVELRYDRLGTAPPPAKDGETNPNRRRRKKRQLAKAKAK